MPLPSANTIQVATKATAHYLARLAASRAGGTEVDFTQGTVILGDGNGDIPPIADLITAGNVLHEVARGSWVQGVEVNPTDDAQTDVLVVVPTVDGNNNEIGPFWVTEYAITDENGAVCLVGTTAIPKLVTANGGLTEVAFIAAEKESNGDVVLTPPSAAFATLYQLMLAINANHVDVTAPLAKTDTILPSGYLQRILSLPPASKPAEADPTVDTANRGWGRPATDIEFAAGLSKGGFAHPWPRLQQVRAALDKQLWELIDDSGVLAADVAAFDVPIPAGSYLLRVTVANRGSSGSQKGIGARFSFDGATYVAANYFWLASSNLGLSNGYGNMMPIGYYVDERPDHYSINTALVFVGAAGVYPSIFNLGAGFQGVPTNVSIASSVAYSPTAGAAQRIRFQSMNWLANASGVDLRAGSRITVERMK